MLHYFGTDLRTHGHYFWKLEGDRIFDSSLNFKAFPFNPEDLFNDSESRDRVSRQKGAVDYFHVDGWSICRIEGSGVDDRGGTKSVFFIKEELSDAELVDRIMNVPIAKKIIEQIEKKFPVQFNNQYKNNKA